MQRRFWLIALGTWTTFLPGCALTQREPVPVAGCSVIAPVYTGKYLGQLADEIDRRTVGPAVGEALKDWDTWRRALRPAAP